MTVPLDPEALTTSIESTLAAAVDGGAVPGVVAGVTTAEHTVAAGAAGVRSTADAAPMTVDTVVALFSATKTITTTAVLRLVDRGDLDLDAPARDHLPALGDIGVVDGFDDDGTPQVRPARSVITTRHLLTHTAGFGYDFYDRTYRRLADDGRLKDVVTATRASLDAPLLFDPGTRWEYGISTDWAGLLVEAVTGRRLDSAIADLVLDPIGMSDTRFGVGDDLRARRATIHHRTSDGGLRPNARFEHPAEPEAFMGGHGMYSTVGDYLTLLRMWLRDGRSDHGEQILRPETVAAAASDQLGSLSVHPLPGLNPKVSNDVDLLPDVEKTWGLGFLVNTEPTPTGRAAGSISWAGLANLYFWIDRASGIAGFWATQVLPFADPSALRHFTDFESAVYRTLAR
ncbi:serine hydrolase domain-containing protein [Gordonia soli]|uniref:Putative esterase n=1 Tax=Gordonia soli NBRC 108243 TaxID=1223545 RepID=M0QGX3_9ACTN|nr:serine hydrolase domain-containing protein [Gordonia soli]GAC66677.1 putative esterase [Gordonia soli NBRC 108243]